MLKRIANKVAQYPRIYTFIRKIIENNFIAHIKIISKEFPKDTGNVLDLACGIGEFSIYFDKDKYIGVDIEEKYIKYGKKKFDRNLIVGNALNLKFKDNDFDFVLISGFLHHLSDEDVEKVLIEITRVLKKNGKFVLIEDAPSSRFLSKKLQESDVGANIRKMEEYEIILSEFFNDSVYCIFKMPPRQ